jgi:hypothetical protein
MLLLHHLRIPQKIKPLPKKVGGLGKSNRDYADLWISLSRN